MHTILFFSPLSLLYLPLFWGLWSIWNWALCSMINTNIFAFFFMQISCLTSTICWRYLFFQCIFSALCQNTGVHVCVNLGLIQLKYTLLFNKPHPQNDHYNESLVWLKVSSKPSSLTGPSLKSLLDILLLSWVMEILQLSLHGTSPFTSSSRS